MLCVNFSTSSKSFGISPPKCTNLPLSLPNDHCVKFLKYTLPSLYFRVIFRREDESSSPSPVGFLSDPSRGAEPQSGRVWSLRISARQVFSNQLLRYSQIAHKCCSPAFVSNENRKYLLKIETLNKSFLSQVPGDSSQRRWGEPT